MWTLSLIHILVQRNIFFKIAVDVPPGLGAFLAGLLGGRDREGKIRVAHQLNDQNLQMCIRDRLKGLPSAIAAEPPAPLACGNSGPLRGVSAACSRIAGQNRR